MDNNGKTQQHSYTIPMDMYMDILRILLPNKIRNYVETLNERENSIILRIETVPGNFRHKQAIENLEEILNEYGYYLKGKPNEEWEE